MQAPSCASVPFKSIEKWRFQSFYRIPFVPISLAIWCCSGCPGLEGKRERLGLGKFGAQGQGPVPNHWKRSDSSEAAEATAALAYLVWTASIQGWTPFRWRRLCGADSVLSFRCTIWSLARSHLFWLLLFPTFVWLSRQSDISELTASWHQPGYDLMVGPTNGSSPVPWALGRPANDAPEMALANNKLPDLLWDLWQRRVRASGDLSVVEYCLTILSVYCCWRWRCALSVGVSGAWIGGPRARTFGVDLIAVLCPLLWDGRRKFKMNSLEWFGIGVPQSTLLSHFMFLQSRKNIQNKFLFKSATDHVI